MLILQMNLPSKIVFLHNFFGFGYNFSLDPFSPVIYILTIISFDTNNGHSCILAQNQRNKGNRRGNMFVVLGVRGNHWQCRLWMGIGQNYDRLYCLWGFYSNVVRNTLKYSDKFSKQMLNQKKFDIFYFVRHRKLTQ